MYTRCTRDVHEMYTRCTQDVHKMYTRCTQETLFGLVNLRRLVPSDVELSLRPSSYVGLSWLALAADNADLGLY